MKPKTNFTLLHDLVMILPVAAIKKTESGLIIPEKEDSTAPSQGFVVACGPGKSNKSGDIVRLEVSVGDRVIFMKNAAKEIKSTGETFLIVPISEVLCKINHEA